MLALALSAALSAWACDGPTHRTDCHLEDLDDALEEERDDRRGRGRGDIDLALGLEGTGLPGAPATGMYADLTGRRGAFFRAESRLTTQERWMGRLSAGLDVLGDDDDFQVRLGLFMGHVGLWQSADYAHLAIGTDITLGAEIDRVSGAVRWVGGKRRGAPGLWNETDISVAYRLVGPFRVHAHWLRMDGGPGERMAGVGLGGSVTF